MLPMVGISAVLQSKLLLMRGWCDDVKPRCLFGLSSTQMIPSLLIRLGLSDVCVLTRGLGDDPAQS